jgi:NAD(P)-dependent dehydrogenase (short-subunit alcohol dehydrogenase family)
LSGWTTSEIRSLEGKKAIVTGGNSGLGYETVKALASHGAKVVLTGRNVEKCEKAAQQIKLQYPQAQILVGFLDVADLTSVKVFAENQLDEPLDFLINNAGIMATPFALTVDGFESQMATNHLGHFALTALLWPALKMSEKSRIVNVSSSAHRLGKLVSGEVSEVNVPSVKYRAWTVYGNSKLANLLFTYQLNKNLKAAGLTQTVTTAHPGFSNTNLQAGVMRGREGLFKSVGTTFLNLGNAIMAQSAEMGALPQIYAAVNQDLTNGEYIGPDGPMEARGYPKIVASSANAQNPQVAQTLWLTSEKLTGISFNI